MNLTQQALNYIKLTKISHCINSNFLITDLEKIIYTENYDSKYNYEAKNLSPNIISLINKWNALPISEEVFLIENNPSLKITKNDTQQYSAVMIFPIYLNNKIEGVVICFREKGNYIASSSKAPNTVRKWIMKYMGNNIFPI